MAYKHSSGERRFDDIIAENDSDSDTKIDFDEDYIALKTNGNNVLVVSGSNVGIGVATPDSTLHIAGNIHVSGSNQEGIRIAKGASDYRQIVFETDGADSANIHLSNAENLVIQNETNGKDIQFWTNPSAASNAQRMVIKEDGKVGIAASDPIAELDVAGKIAITAEMSTPSQPADGKGYLYTKTDGKLYWRSYDVSETDLTQGGGGGGGNNLSTTSPKTGNYTASNWEFVLVNLVGASNDVTITLPAASSNVQVAVKISSLAMGKTVTVDGNASETIDGTTTKTLDSDYESIHLISDGSAWWRIS